jgi:outer membrane lipoprotein SlyB
MARRYAAALGLLAFAAVLCRGAAAGGAWESTLGFATACLCVFAVLGAIAGRVAEGIVEEAIRGRLTTEMASRPGSPPGPRGTPQRS